MNDTKSGQIKETLIQDGAILLCPHCGEMVAITVKVEAEAPVSEGSYE